MSRGAAAAVLFAVVSIGYLPGNLGCSDSVWSVPTAVSLLDHGDPDLDEYLPILRERQMAFVQRVGDHYYTVYPFATSMLAMPALALLRPIANAIAQRAPRLWARLEAADVKGGGCPPVEAEPVVALRSVTEHVIAAAFVAAAAAFVFLIADAEVPRAAAILVALTFAFGTSAWSSASRGLWQHAPSMLFLSLALWLQLRGARLFWIGCLFGIAYIVRPTNLIPLAAAGVWAASTRPREFPAFLLGIAAPLVPWAWSNRIIFDAWLPPYYTPGFFKPNAYKAEALAGLLVSPNRGLLVFSPVVALSAVGLAMKWKAGRTTVLDWSLAGVIVAHWMVLGTTNAGWWGGASYGPRLFSDVMPYFAHLLLPVVAWIASARGSARTWTLATAAVLALASVAMHAQGALNPSALAWNAFPVRLDFDPIRVWDWRQPQFLAGITFAPSPPPPVNLDAVACTSPPDAPGEPAVVENSGGTVVLRWAPSTRPVAVYLMEVGSGPGAADMPPRESRDTAHPSVVARRVPPGTYYVRVRGRNRCGDGPASPEIAVTIR